MSSSDSDSAGTSDSDTRRRRQEAAEAAARRRRRNWQTWFQRRVLVRLCEMCYDQQLRDTASTERQRSGRLAALGKRAEGHDAETVRSYTCAQVAETLSRQLRQDAGFLQSLFSDPLPPNDFLWIQATGKWGGA